MANIWEIKSKIKIIKVITKMVINLLNGVLSELIWEHTTCELRKNCFYHCLFYMLM